MSWVEDALSHVVGQGATDEDRPPAVSAFTRRLEEELSRVSTLEEARDLLAASSVLLQAASLRGDLMLTDWTAVLHGMDVLRPSAREIVVIGLGDAGYSLLAALADRKESAAATQRLFIDVETSRHREIDPGTAVVMLESFPAAETDRVPRYGDLLRASYRGAAGSDGLPPLITEALGASQASRVTVHVVVSMEEPWLALAPDILFDIRQCLGWGRRGWSLLHLLTRPSPRLRGSYLESVRELERTKPFDDAFIVCAGQNELAERVATFLDLTGRAPELLVHPRDAALRGPFSSYGTATMSSGTEEAPERFLEQLDRVHRLAAPSWIPANVVLSELASERVYYVHPPESPPPDSAWKLCPELIPLPLGLDQPVLCRIQRGLKLEDLRLL